MAKTSPEAKRDLEREARLVEVDGEFCVPFEETQTRHYIDLGPFEVERSPWYVVKKFLLFLPAIFLFILAIQLMKSGATAVGPSIEGQFPFANGLSTLGTGWLGAYFVLSGSPVAATAISLFGAGDDLQARGVHDAVGIAAGRLVHRAAHGIPLRDEAQGQAARRLDRHRHPGHDDDRHHVHPGHAARLLDHPGGLAGRVQPARVGQARRRPGQALGSVRRPRGDPSARVGAVPGRGSA